MTGPCRKAYHGIIIWNSLLNNFLTWLCLGVPRILEHTMPPQFSVDSAADSEWAAPYTEYLRTTRININVRQVFPVGFKPDLACFCTEAATVI